MFFLGGFRDDRLKLCNHEMGDKSRLPAKKFNGFFLGLKILAQNFVHIICKKYIFCSCYLVERDYGDSHVVHDENFAMFGRYKITCL